MIDTSIVIVNFNTRKLTQECLNSVKKYTKGINYEVIVVDNASLDGSIEVLKQRKDVSLILSQKNLGFASGNNLGIKKAVGKYILLLNSDTQLIENSIKTMFDWMEKNINVGIAGCKLLNFDKTLQPNGGYFPTLSRIFAWAVFLDDLPGSDKFIKPYHPRKRFYDKEKYLDWVTGAFFMMRKEIVEKEGLLDERFFMYVEELEYCYRIRAAGWDIAYTPITQIIHLGGASSPSQNAVLGEYKGLRLFYKLHKDKISCLLLDILLKTGSLLRMLIMGVILQKKGALQTYVKAFTID